MSDEEKPIQNMTRQELMKMVKKMEAEFAEREAEHADEVAQYESLKAQQAGFLVTTPNPLYEGVVCGVRFSRGMAFIPLTREFPEYVPQKTKESYFDKFGYTPEERAAVREREKQPTAALVAAKLKGDFGYKVEFLTEDRLDVVKKREAQRAVEAATARERLEKERAAANTLMPNYMGR